MDVRWRTVDIDTWERRATFHAFRAFAFPSLVVGANLSLGDSLSVLKAQGMSTYLGMVYVICRAANEVPAFRLRIRGDEVIEHARAHADYTVPSGNESFTIKTTPYSTDFRVFCDEASRAESGLFHASEHDYSDHWIFMSCLPWINFTHVVQPTDGLSASIPRIIWGRYFEEGGHWKVPLSVQVHHALVDGLHVARFLEIVEALLASPESTFH